VSTPFFDSRWVTPGEHVRLAGPGLPAGFRAGGVAAGIKPSGQRDVALLVCDAEDATSAARFTRSGTAAPPVLLTRETCRLDGLRTVVVNAGNANCATGPQGLEHATRMQRAAAEIAGTEPAQTLVASTGVIGVPLPIDRVLAGIEGAGADLSPTGDEHLAAAIRTTDAFAKHANLELTLPSGTVRLSAQAKGAGMMEPDFATLLCFVQTDAKLAPETAELLLGVTVKRSFERISVDGQLSTNDTVVLQASGASGVEVVPESEDELRFGEALDQLLRQLALLVVRDGEGAERIGRVVVRGGEPETVERVARAVANSALVKTALHGGDPNWGRIIQAVGMTLPGTAPLPVDVDIEGVRVCAAGTALEHDVGALEAAVRRNEVEYVIGLPGDGAETEVFFSDLGYGYIKINAEYTT
jgi:glutamate N-acetyltransferase / amino-acid N-acetyltransferase